MGYFLGLKITMTPPKHVSKIKSSYSTIHIRFMKNILSNLTVVMHKNMKHSNKSSIFDISNSENF
jgi:hypothetical protein